jgi:hypothetical protein
MTFSRAASFGMPARTRHIAQSRHIATQSWLTSPRPLVPPMRASLLLERTCMRLSHRMRFSNL